MAKNLLLILSGIIFCAIVVTAQNTVSKENYERWVDYVDLFYVKSYVDKKINNSESGFYNQYKEDYKNRISKKWEDLINNQKALSYNDLKNDLGGHKNTIALCSFINEKKKISFESFSKEQLIGSLLDLPNDKPSKDGNGFKGYLSNTTNLLKKHLQKQIPDNLFSTKETQEEVIKQAKPEQTITSAESKEQIQSEQSSGVGNNEVNSENLKKPFNHSRTFSWGWLVLLFLAILMIALLLRFRKELFKWIIQKINLNNQNPEEVYLPKETSKSLELENKRLLQNIKQWENDNAKLHTENKQLRDKIRELENKRQSITTNVTLSAHAVIAETKENNSALQGATRFYADSINQDGFFNHISKQPNEDTVFEISLLNAGDRTATFTVYSGAFKRILKNADFVEGCEKQKISSTPHSLEVESGEVLFVQEIGKWKITNKAKIKFV